MTTNYGGMTPWQYNEWARSRETDGGGGGGSGGSTLGYGNWSSPSARLPTNVAPPQLPNTPAEIDPYKDIDRSPFHLGDNDAIALARQQRVRDVVNPMRYNLAGMPQPIELWSGNVADTQRTTPIGTLASLTPGTGEFGPSASVRAYSLAREAYLSDPIRAAIKAQAAPPPPPPSGG
jgi:hypothetical protein